MIIPHILSRQNVRTGNENRSSQSAFFSLLCSVLLDAQQARIDVSKMVDLTYAFDESTIYDWPTAKPFQWEKESWA